MSILTVNNLGQSFGAFDVFGGLSARIESDSKIGLVGPNGIGKTTLLRILAGLDEAGSGIVEIDEAIRIGYLRQEAVEAFAQKENTIYEEMLTVFDGLHAMENRLRELETIMVNGSASDDDFIEYGDVQDAFALAGGYDYDVRIKQILEGLGFKSRDYGTPLHHLSGGQKTRALLARLLLEKPHLLILDEPTNHLDIGAVTWLEGALRLWEGALLIVSHDRYFLDKVVNRIWEMTRGSIETYKGNYTAYLRQRDERRERMAKEWDGMMERLENEFAFIQKFFAGSRHDIAAGKLKRLAREVEMLRVGGLDAIHAIQKHGWGQASDMYDLKRTAQTVKELYTAIKGLENPVKQTQTMKLNLRAAERGGETIIRTNTLTIGYPDQPLFETDFIHLLRAECAALIGPNGSGKTTFLKTLLGQFKPLAGTIEFGVNLKIGYFAQAHDTLNVENTVVDELISHKNIGVAAARQHLARYLFRGEDVYKQVGDLSGGERGRLALAKLALDGANVLLLDEPTNHLDIPAQEALQTAFEAFDGTILLVSHDRYLVNRLASQIWEIRGDRLQVFNGTYQEYLAQAAVSEEPDVPETRNVRAVISEKEGKQRAKRQRELEAKIHETEATLATLFKTLEAAGLAHNLDEVYRIGDAYDSARRQLDTLMAEWEDLAEQVH